MKTIKSWEKINEKLLEDIDLFREQYVCHRNCEEWKRWKYCLHLRKAIARKFSEKIDSQMESLVDSSTTVVFVEPSQSLVIP